MSDWQRALARAEAGERITPEEGLALLEEADFFELGRAAAARARRLAEAAGRAGVITFVVDRNINYSNICTAGCRFCAFYRRRRDPDAYVLTREEVVAKVRELVEAGGTQVLMQGGLHPALPFDYYLDLVRSIRETFPGVDVHSFSPPEIQHFARLYGFSVRRVLEELRAAGLASLPGGGAEVLVDRVRRAVSPGKIGWRQWAEVMEAAAEVGLRATATMMFGHLETPAERILHLDRVRAIQDRTAGCDPAAPGEGVFRAFIPWSFQPFNTRLAHVRPATAYEYLRLVATSRLYLDNVPHLQASWVTQGPRVGQLALACGCDDMGGTMMEENVVRQAGASFRLSREEMIRLIAAAGFTPARRDTAYRILEVCDPAPAEGSTVRQAHSAARCPAPPAAQRPAPPTARRPAGPAEARAR